MISVEVSTPNSVSVDDVVNRVEVDITTTGTSGSGVTDHGALTGLTDDDHPQYQRADSVFTTTSPYTITDESLLVTTGTAVTLPDAASNAGRMVSIGSAGSNVTISPAGTDTIHGIGSTYTLAATNGLTFVSINIGGWGWAIINRRGTASDLPEWFGQGIADGNLITLQAGVPAWTTGTRTAEEFLSGTGWTDDVPVLIPVKNTSAGTIAKGAPVYATGTVGSTSVVEIAPADCDDAAKMPAIGLTNSSLAVNATGYVTVVGTIKGVDTAAYTVNQTLYVSTTAGQLTGTKPTGTSELIQGIGRVTRVNSSTGEILVLGAGRTNDIPNAIDASKITTGTVAYARLPVGTTASTVAAGDDARMTDSRRPVWQRVIYNNADITLPAFITSSMLLVQTGTLTTTRTVTLQPVATFGAAKEIIAWSGAGVSSTNKLVIAAASGETINGAATYEVTQPNRFVRLMSNTASAPTSGNPNWFAQTFNVDASEVTSGTLSNDRLNAELKALGNLTSAADALPYFTGSGTAALATFTSAGRALIDDVDAAAQRTTLGLASIASSGSASDLSAGTIDFARLPTGTTSTTVAVGNDSRLSRPPSLFVSGQYTSGSFVSTGNAGATNNRLYYQPLYVPRTVTVDRIAVSHAATTAGAGSVMRLGIYNSTNDLPSTLLLDAGTVDLTTAAALKTVTVNQQLTAGLYWLAAVGQITSGSPTFVTGNPGMHVPDVGSTFTGVKFEAGVTGALPANATPGTTNTTQPPLVYLRIT